MANITVKSTEKRPIQVLIVDTVAAGSNRLGVPFAMCDGFFHSLGARVEYIVQYDSGTTVIGADQKVFSEPWDLIVVPLVASGATTEYTGLKTFLSQFKDTTIPVFIQGAISAGTATAKALLGTTSNAASYSTRQAAALTNWESRQTSTVDFYGDAVVLDAITYPTVKSIAQLSASAVMMWSHTYLSHPVLTIGGSSNVTNQFYIKPWYGAQWMIDQCSDATRKQELKDIIRKRYCLMRWDGLGNTPMNTSYLAGSLDSVYNTYIEYGLKEVWVAAMWTQTTGGTLTPGTNYPVVANWFLARSEKTVGDGALFRITNHETDIYNGTVTYNGVGTEERCSSDGLLFDGFKDADYAYRKDCDHLTTYGFIVGTDGYGAGYPNVQDGNDMGNPAAKFLADTEKLYDTDGFYGGIGVGAIWLTLSENYPTAEAVAKQCRYRGSVSWYGAPTLATTSLDTVGPGANDVSLTLNGAVLRAFIHGGSIYQHGATDFTQTTWAAQYAALFTTCPDVLASGPWEDMLTDLKQGTPWRRHATYNY